MKTSTLHALGRNGFSRCRQYSQHTGQLSIDVMRNLPKAELHCHLDGSLKVQTIIELAKEQGIELPSYDVKELSSSVTVSENCTSLVEYLRGFDITLKVLQKPYAISRAVYEMAKDAHADGVRYLEIRFSPILHIAEGLSLSVMEAVCEGQALAQYKLPIIVQIIVCGMRQLDPSETVKLAEIAWRYNHKGVCAFDLAGPEEGFSSKYHADAISIVRRKFVNITLHSGEAFGWESVQDSLQYCGAHRLGHGTRMRENPRLVDYVADIGVAIEVCLTSNVHTKSITDMASHPVREYFDKGVVIVPCTDNTVVSGITLSEEYCNLQKYFNFSLEEIIRVIDYGFKSAFLETSTKNRIRAEVLRDCIQILRREGYNVTSIVQNSSYFDWIGVNIAEILDPVPEYWKSWLNPIITRELCRLLPKVDLHCRFEREVTSEMLYKELESNPDCMELAKELLPFTCKEEFVSQLRSDVNDANWLKMVRCTIRTKAQIETVINGIYERALHHSVRYIELFLNPKLFQRSELETEDILLTVLNHTRKLNIEHSGQTYVGVVIVSSSPNTVIDSLEMAKLAVKYRDEGVLGFALKPHSIGLSLEDYSNTISLLKEFHIKSSLHADQVKTISYALSDGRAQRIFGASEIHMSPTILNYLSNHDILLEISVDKVAKDFPDLFPISLLLDSFVPFNLSSYLKRVDSNLSYDLFTVVQKCKLPIDRVIFLLNNGFRCNFLNHAKRQQIALSAKHETEELLRNTKFKFLYKQHYFPDE